MSVVIIGGHDRMVHQYKKVCKNYNCKAKVFTQMAARRHWKRFWTKCAVQRLKRKKKACFHRDSYVIFEINKA